MYRQVASCGSVSADILAPAGLDPPNVWACVPRALANDQEIWTLEETRRMGVDSSRTYSFDAHRETWDDDEGMGDSDEEEDVDPVDTAKAEWAMIQAELEWGIASIAGSYRHVAVWDLAQNALVKIIADHEDSVRMDGTRLVSCSKDRTVHFVLGAHRAALNAVSLSDTLIVSGFGDRSVTSGTPPPTSSSARSKATSRAGAIASIDFMAPYVVSGSSDKHLRLFDITTFQLGCAKLQKQFPSGSADYYDTHGQSSCSIPVLVIHSLAQLSPHDSDTLPRNPTMVVAPCFRVGASVALVLHSFLATRAFAASTNTTVDDTNNTIWTFVGGWSGVTPKTPCPGCFAQPDPTQVFNSSWHDGSVVSGSVTFPGSAIYIYGIDMTATSGTNISFSMNNPTTAGFHYFGSTGTTYNVLFFSATNLDPSVEHTVSFFGQSTVPGSGAMLFDYAKVTVDQQETVTPSESSSPSSTTQQLVAIAITIAIAVAVAVAVIQRKQFAVAIAITIAIAIAIFNHVVELIQYYDFRVRNPLCFNLNPTNLGHSTPPSPSSTPAPSAPPPPPTQRSNTGAIIGAVVGVVGGLAILIALFLFLRRRKRTSAKAPRRRISANGFATMSAPPASTVPSATQVSGSTTSLRPAVTTATSTSQSAPGPWLALYYSGSVLTRGTESELIWNSETAWHARESNMEERLRQLEALVQPPQYDS
ncbi:hypothetical protein GGX14DRAFT_587821 [Mycena pura]|uniref:WD40 repeat-like protein n=1 Tax=Mycena pura TaxID=153505 RepID=A0AAD6UWL1_9AGAR|nr:hypothetical protein GGX14DRAFT_587821 [Mycena pura]